MDLWTNSSSLAAHSLNKPPTMSWIMSVKNYFLTFYSASGEMSISSLSGNSGLHDGTIHSHLILQRVLVGDAALIESIISNYVGRTVEKSRLFIGVIWYLLQLLVELSYFPRSIIFVSSRLDYVFQLTNISKKYRIAPRGASKWFHRYFEY